MKAATPSPRGLGKRSEGDSRACRPHRFARVRGGAHGQLPGGEGAHRQGKEQRKEGRQEIRGEEWSEGDKRHGRLSREVAVEHRGSDRDTRRNQRNDPGDRLQRNEEVLC